MRRDVHGDQAHIFGIGYSWRIAFTGSSPAARRAGSQQANTPTAAKPRATIRKIDASDRAMPKGSDAIRRANGSAAPSPGAQAPHRSATIRASSPAAGSVTAATDVHHLAKIADAPERRIDRSKLMSLCKRHHDIRTAPGE